jgi:hypothetical protein
MILVRTNHPCLRVRCHNGLVHHEVITDLLTYLLHELLEHHLDIGIHSTELLLPTGEVVVLL